MLVDGCPCQMPVPPLVLPAGPQGDTIVCNDGEVLGHRLSIDGCAIDIGHHPLYL